VWFSSVLSLSRTVETIVNRPVPLCKGSPVAHPIRVKICGVTTAIDAVLAAEAGADAIGINFHPASPRYVGDVAERNLILIELPPFVSPVGVFVGASFREAFGQMHRFRSIRTIQLHGDRHEPERRFPYKRIDAFSVRDHDDLEKINRYLALAGEIGHMPAAVLVDGYAAGLRGGTGRTAPWAILADFHPRVPVILAGGLTPDNVAEAIRIVRPYAVDVASGVESAPGRKDPEKMRCFIAAAQEAAAKLEPRRAR
jgi:phosphoribosylanthranilate isomerase